MKNREIKFRVWDKTDKKWYSNHYTITQDGELFLLIVTNSPLESKLIKVNPESYQIQQFTGILDKNDKEIYEGDIVKYRYESYSHEWDTCEGEVFFDKGVFYFGRRDMFASNDSNFDLTSLEVIGNIFENPELI